MRSFFVILFLFMLTCTSCGVFTKLGKRTAHEVKQVVTAQTQATAVQETTIAGDSLIELPSSFIETMLPFGIDTSMEATDSIVSEDVKVYIKPAYHIAENGKKVLKGVQVKAITPAKIIKPKLTITEKKVVNLQEHYVAKSDSTKTEKQIIRKHDTRYGGFIWCIIGIGVLCVCWYIFKHYK